MFVCKHRWETRHTQRRLLVDGGGADLPRSGHFVCSVGSWQPLRQRREGEWGWSEPILTGVKTGRGFTVPFNALAEGYIVESFRRAGSPMARIRPAIEVLRNELGLENALLSEKLKTDGAEILIENGENELVVVRNHQGVFRDVVEQYLQSISYRDGFVEFVHLPAYERTDVVVDPDETQDSRQSPGSAYELRMS